MAEPWFDPNLFGAVFGSVAGGVGGTLGGLLGAAAGVLAPRGKARGLVLGGFWLFVAIGVGLLGLGLYALAVGQPFGIWFFPTLVGVIFVAVMGGLLPVVKQRYAQAEARRLEAEGLRQG